METERVSGVERPRREDRALVTGAAKYTHDLTRSGTLSAAILRSRYGHARIAGVDTAHAESSPGVVAVFTAEDLEDSGVPGRIHVPASLVKLLPDSVDPPEQKSSDVPLLAADRVRYSGEPIAVVVAEDRYAAQTAVDRIRVEYEPLPAAVTTESALAEAAPVLHEVYDDNVALDWSFGDHEANERAFENADHVVEIEVENQRLIPNPLEPRAALAEVADDRLTVHMSTAVPHRARGRLAKVLGMAEDSVRVIAPAVGGAFGSKGNRPYVEEPLTAWCAMQLDRPVKWAGTRSESFQADCHGRDVRAQGRLALDADGTFRGLYVDGQLNVGAYLGWEFTVGLNFHRHLSNTYDIPSIAGRFVGAFTNKAPVGPYRGAGTPNAIVLVERLVDQAADELDMDPAELRRRNFIDPDAFPFETDVGEVYDSGNYLGALEKALGLLDYDAVRERQARLREEGRYLGIGIGAFVKKTGLSFSEPGACRMRFDESGTVTAFFETADHGQGHETTFAQLVADELGVGFDDVVIREGDTADLPTGLGTFACRSVPVGGSAIVEAAAQVRAQAERAASAYFEVAGEDLVFEGGSFSIRGSPDQSVHISELARSTYGAMDRPAAVAEGFETTGYYDPESVTHPFGVHVAVVEVDPDSGEIRFDRYVAVDDVGVQVNPLLVRGQILGGIAQGLGQALYENAVYDDNGTLLSGSFLDYTMPKAEHVPEIEIGSTVTPCPHNPLGAKGCGENGNNGAPPAVMNAVVDALRPLGVRHIDTPLTEEAVWQAIQAAS